MTDHPTSFTIHQLVDGLLPADEEQAASDHIGSCNWCRTQFIRLNGAPPVSVVNAVPAAAGFASPRETTGPPVPNQLRRLSWGNCLGLGAVRRVEPLRVLVQIAVPDGNILSDLSTRMECIIGTQQVDLELLTVACWLPLAILDAHVGECTSAAITADRACDATDFDEELLSVADDPDVDHDLLDHLSDLVQNLSEADSWYADLQVVAGLGAQTWMNVGIATRRALDLARGATPTVEEERALVSSGLVPGVPQRLWDEITRELSSPRVKAPVRQRAQREAIPELQVRRNLVEQLRQPIAARTPGGDPLTIRERLDGLLS